MSAGMKEWRLRYEAQNKKSGGMRNVGPGDFGFDGGLLAHDLENGANKRKQEWDGQDFVGDSNAEPGRDHFPHGSEEEFHAVTARAVF